MENCSNDSTHHSPARCYSARDRAGPVHTREIFHRSISGHQSPPARHGQGFSRSQVRLPRYQRRSFFGEIIVHVSSGNAYAAKAGRGEKANWDEIDPKGYATKAAMVALLEKTIADADATLKATPPDRFSKTVQPWLAVIEHAGEHYGQLVVYYRNNGMVPPESRQTPKR